MTLRELSDSDNGATIRLAPDDELALSLPESPTTGYRWELEDAGPLRLERDDFLLAGEPSFGSGGTRIFTLRASGAGSGSLRLRHWQSWSGDESVTQRYSLEVHVTEPA